MSHDLRIHDHRTDEQKHFEEPLDLRGGTYAVGGTTEAWLNVTYNYGTHYHTLWGHGLGAFDGKTVEEVRPLAEEAVAALGTERHSDYWKPTKGNAGAAMADLLTMLNACHNSDVLRVC